MKKILLLILSVSFLNAQSTSPISGQAFLDFTYNSNHYLSQLKNKNNFDIKRILIFYDKSFSEDVNFKFGIEGNNSDTTTSGAFNYFVKALFFEKKINDGKYSIKAGLHPVSTNAFDEKIWGNRFLEKVILDKNGFGAPTDLGVSFSGKLISNLDFNLAVVNGTGIKPENDKNKKILSSFIYKIDNQISFEVYNDFENVKNGKNKLTSKVSGNYSNADFNIGLTVFNKNYKNLGYGIVDSTTRGYSAFSTFNINEKLKLIGRYDFFDKNINNTINPNTDSFILVGLNYLVEPKIFLSPNILIKQNSIGTGDTKKTNGETYLRLNVGIYF